MPVTVLLWPAAINATAKSIGADFPKKDGNNSWASCISFVPAYSVPKNNVPANTSIAAFTKNARLSAIVVSILLNFIACLIPKSVRSIFLDCTNAECK